MVSKSHIPQSDPGGGQAVSLGGRPLKRRTWIAGEEGGGGGRPCRWPARAVALEKKCRHRFDSWARLWWRAISRLNPYGQ